MKPLSHRFDERKKGHNGVNVQNAEIVGKQHTQGFSNPTHQPTPPALFSLALAIFNPVGRARTEICLCVYCRAA